MASRQTLLMSLLEQNVVSRHNYLFCVAQNMLMKKKCCKWQSFGRWPYCSFISAYLHCIIFSYSTPHMPTSGAADAQKPWIQHSASKRALSFFDSKAEDSPWAFLQQNWPRLLLLAKKHRPKAIPNANSQIHLQLTGNKPVCQNCLQILVEFQDEK